ncbi:MAG: hypothetical protein HY814_06445 [Candidatus Riflebacteria bacterium]|nr:hypothetical protein [Candidatus Riflebacteria bacterium]
MNGHKMTTSKVLTGVLVLACMLFAAAAPVSAQYGRTEGGYAGTALGLAGGSALGAAIASAAGIGNPLLGGAIMATSALGGGFLGAKLGSGVGNEIDHAFTANRIWSIVGGVTGGLLGFVMMPGGSVVSKALGAAIGAAVGGWIGDKLAGKANVDFNPRSVGAMIGGINGALLGGPFGAAVGVPLGYIGGDLFDKYVFVDPDTRLADYYDKWRQGGSNPPTGPRTVPANLDPNVYDREGFDREGYDWTGYNRHGYDREGYDRLGYNQYGIDRQGFDRRGFRLSVTATPGTTGTTSTGVTTGTTVPSGYDPSIYRNWWSAWSQLGGRYPELGPEHWNAYPVDSRVAYQERYVQRYSRVVKLDVQAYFPPGTSLAEKRAAYREAIERVRTMAMDNSTPMEVRQAALQKLSQLERDLAATLGENR